MTDRNSVDERENASQRRLFLATALATPGEKRVAFAIAAISFVAFLAFIPFVRVPLARMPAFIPSYETALFFVDLITAILLFEQFVRLRSTGVLILASGYLFDALIIVAHAMSFPGAFSPSGLLGAREQTTAWLYVFWHGGFSLFVVAYALTRRREILGAPQWQPQQVRVAIMTSFGFVIALVVALTLVATWGHDMLPVVMRGPDYSLLVTKGISPAVLVMTLIAAITLWRRDIRAIDLWLMLVMWIWLFDIGLSAVLGSARYDLGFYAGRIFGLLSASFLLITLVVQMARLYAGALGQITSAERKLAALASQRDRADGADMQPMRGEPIEAFIHRQNIAHYRTLLESGTLDPDRRAAIEKLLSAEEERYRSGG